MNRSNYEKHLVQRLAHSKSSHTDSTVTADGGTGLRNKGGGMAAGGRTHPHPESLHGAG